MTRSETDNGPDLRVYLATADANQDSAGDDFVDLGGLTRNVGDQQYEIPRGADLERLTKGSSGAAPSRSASAPPRCAERALECFRTATLFVVAPIAGGPRNCIGQRPSIAGGLSLRAVGSPRLD